MAHRPPAGSQEPPAGPPAAPAPPPPEPGDGAHLSPTLLDRMQRPRNHGRLTEADGRSFVHGDCGDEMAVWIATDGDRIRRIAFVTSGCGMSLAAGSMATELAADRPLRQAMRLRQQDVLAGLGGMPCDHRHCALLAATAVQLACEDALLRRLAPGSPPGAAVGAPPESPA